MKKPWAIWKVGKEEYKLNISAGATIDAEQKLGESLLSAMTKMDRMDVRITVLHAALQRYHHGMGYEDTLNLYDRFTDAGGTLDDLMDVILEAYKVSGFMREGEEQAESRTPEPSQT